MRNEAPFSVAACHGVLLDLSTRVLLFVNRLEDVADECLCLRPSSHNQRCSQSISEPAGLEDAVEYDRRARGEPPPAGARQKSRQSRHSRSPGRSAGCRTCAPESRGSPIGTRDSNTEKRRATQRRSSSLFPRRSRCACWPINRLAELCRTPLPERACATPGRESAWGGHRCCLTLDWLWRRTRGDGECRKNTWPPHFRPSADCELEPSGISRHKTGAVPRARKDGRARAVRAGALSEQLIRRRGCHAGAQGGRFVGLRPRCRHSAFVTDQGATR